MSQNIFPLSHLLVFSVATQKLCLLLSIFKLFWGFIRKSTQWCFPSVK